MKVKSFDTCFEKQAFQASVSSMITQANLVFMHQFPMKLFEYLPLVVYHNVQLSDLLIFSFISSEFDGWSLLFAQPGIIHWFGGHLHEPEHY